MIHSFGIGAMHLEAKVLGKRVLITGVTGFAGSHLAEFLLGLGDLDVFGTVRWRSKRENIRHISGLNLIECELRDAVSVERALDEVRPDYVFHLAAQSFVPTSWSAPADTMVNNIAGQLNLFEASRRLKLNPRFQVACSSEEYGMVLPDETPITEENPLRPLSPYGVSKVAQDLLGYQYFKSYDLHVVRTRTFNHTGPRRGHVFATSNFARQIAEIEAGMRNAVIQVGNLSARRDFTDVRDVVRAYWMAITRGEAGEVYQICSGKAYAISEVLDMLLARTEMPIRIEVDPGRLRPSDVPLLLGSFDKFHRQTGWFPNIPLTETLRDLLDYWRARIPE